MNLLADENIPSQLVRQLRRLGHDVRYAAELEPGLSDEGWLDAWFFSALPFSPTF